MKIKLKTTVEHLEALREVLPNVEINSQTFTTWNLNPRELKAKQAIMTKVANAISRRCTAFFHLEKKGKTTLTLEYYEAHTLFIFLKYQNQTEDDYTNNVIRIMVSELDKKL